jgi:hypothetical protein
MAKFLPKKKEKNNNKLKEIKKKKTLFSKIKLLKIKILK